MERGKEINHWCVLCGTGYHACDTCNKEKTFTPWRTLTDTIEHFKIFMVLKDYNNKLISKEEAKDYLEKLDLSGKENFKDSAKKVLADIYMEDSKEILVVKDNNTLPKKSTNKQTRVKSEKI